MTREAQPHFDRFSHNARQNPTAIRFKVTVVHLQFENNKNDAGISKRAGTYTGCQQENNTDKA